MTTDLDRSGECIAAALAREDSIEADAGRRLLGAICMDLHALSRRPIQKI